MQIKQDAASVGIVVGARATGGRPAVILQERAPHDSYPRGCQVFSHGKLTPEELRLDESTALSTALGRKLREEVGLVAAQMVEAAHASTFELDRTVNSKGRLIVTLGVDLGIEAEKLMAKIVPGKDVGGFRICVDPATIKIMSDEHKIVGVPANETWMFPDEKLAVTRFFDRRTI